MSYLSAFTNQMEAFASELSSMFPEDVDLKTALNMIKMIKKVNPRKLLSVFEKFTNGYKDQIMSKDERFFIAPCDTVVSTIPTYSITMPEIQNMIVFNEESLAYISDTAPPPPPPPPPPPHNYLEPLTQQQTSSEIFRMAIGNDNDGVDAQPEDAGDNSIQSSVTIDASNIIIVSANGTNYSIARV